MEDVARHPGGGIDAEGRRGRSVAGTDARRRGEGGGVAHSIGGCCRHVGAARRPGPGEIPGCRMSGRRPLVDTPFARRVREDLDDTPGAGRACDRTLATGSRDGWRAQPEIPAVDQLDAGPAVIVDAVEVDRIPRQPPIHPHAGLPGVGAVVGDLVGADDVARAVCQGDAVVAVAPVDVRAVGADGVELHQVIDAVDDGNTAPTAGKDDVADADPVVVRAIVDADTVVAIGGLPSPVDWRADHVAFHDVALRRCSGDEHPAPVVPADPIALARAETANPVRARARLDHAPHNPGCRRRRRRSSTQCSCRTRCC